MVDALEDDSLLVELEAAFDDQDPAAEAAAAAAAEGVEAAAEPPAKRHRPEPATAPAPAGPDHAANTAEVAAGTAAPAAVDGSFGGGGPLTDSSPLVALSELLLLRVLAALSPEDLLVLGRTSRYFRAAASDGTLWRRLYHSRWPEGPQQEDAEHVQGASWQLLYIERDHQSVLEARQSAPSAPLLPIYLQMATARRSEPLSSADAQALYRSPASNRSLQLSAKVDAFRRQKGLLDSNQHARHSCLGGCSWQQLDNNAWICERGGFVHVCDAGCAFRELDPSSDLQVCTISGRCFAHMMTEREEHAGEWERGQSRSGRAEAEEDWAAEDGISGRLGRAFYAGYNAETPDEFFRSFGVRF